MKQYVEPTFESFKAKYKQKDSLMEANKLYEAEKLTSDKFIVNFLPQNAEEALSLLQTLTLENFKNAFDKTARSTILGMLVKLLTPNNNSLVKSASLKAAGNSYELHVEGEGAFRQNYKVRGLEDGDFGNNLDKKIILDIPVEDMQSGQEYTIGLAIGYARPKGKGYTSKGLDDKTVNGPEVLMKVDTSDKNLSNEIEDGLAVIKKNTNVLDNFAKLAKQLKDKKDSAENLEISKEEDLKKYQALLGVKA